MNGLWFCLSSFFTCVDALRLADHGTWSNLLDFEFLSQNPRTYECGKRSDNVTENLDDYAAFFDAGYGKTIVMGGDSLMKQMVMLIDCVSRELGLYVQSTGVKNDSQQNKGGMIRIKRFQDAPDDAALVIQFHYYYSFSGIPSYRSESRSQRIIPFDVVLQGAETYDYMFLNFGHHALSSGGPQGWTFERIADAIFTETKNTLAGRNAHLVWLGHPPSHFDSKDGSWNFRSLKCTCNLGQQQLAQQCIVKGDKIAKQLSSKYGFEYVSIWEDMVAYCDGHIHQTDCLHYQLMPQLWTGPIRKITAVMKRSRQ